MGMTYANYITNVNNIQGNGMVAYGLAEEIDHLSGQLNGVAWTTGQMSEIFTLLLWEGAQEIFQSCQCDEKHFKK